MRKIALILSFMMLLGITLASAEITRGEDTFTGGKTINSGTSADPSELKSLYFSKTVQVNAVEYEIQATRVTFKSFIFSSTFIELKIDENPVHKMVVKETSMMPLVNKNDIYSSITVPVQNDIVQEIKDAKRIALRFQTVAGPYVYVLPDSVLAEWKEVIDTEK